MEKVTILLSSYNGSRFIREQLNSIIDQKDVNLNVIIRDDGSTDDTTDIIEGFENNKINLIKSNNIGATNSFLQLIKSADISDYYAFSDQDDYWEIQKIKAAIEKLKDYTDISAVYSSNTTLVDKNLKFIKKEAKDVKTDLGSAIVKNYATGCTMVFNKKAMETIKKGVEVDVPFHDWWINLIVLATGGISIFDNSSYVKYRQHGDNVVGGTENLIVRYKQRMKKFNKPYHREKMAEKLIEIYGDLISKENTEILKLISNYKSNKLNIVFNKNIKTSSFIDNLFFSICLLCNKI